MTNQGSKSLTTVIFLFLDSDFWIINSLGSYSLPLHIVYLPALKF
jgi:hypothetical protein